jgi:hypothetical protein
MREEGLSYPPADFVVGTGERQLRGISGLDESNDVLNTNVINYAFHGDK